MPSLLGSPDNLLRALEQRRAEVKANPNAVVPVGPAGSIPVTEMIARIKNTLKGMSIPVDDQPEDGPKR